MKLYENGEVRELNEQSQEYELVGRHTVDLDGLFSLTDERGTYASFAANQLPKEVTLFADVEKNADFLLKQMKKMQGVNLKIWIENVFEFWPGRHLWEKHMNGKNRTTLVDFYLSLDAENSQLFIKALVRL